MFHCFEIMIHDSEKLKCSMAHSNVSWPPAVFHCYKLCFMILQNVPWFLQLLHGWRSVSWLRRVLHGSEQCFMFPRNVSLWRRVFAWLRTVFHDSEQRLMVSKGVPWFRGVFHDFEKCEQWQWFRFSNGRGFPVATFVFPKSVFPKLFFSTIGFYPLHIVQ